MNSCRNHRQALWLQSSMKSVVRLSSSVFWFSLLETQLHLTHRQAATLVSGYCKPGGFFTASTRDVRKARLRRSTFRSKCANSLRPALYPKEYNSEQKLSTTGPGRGLAPRRLSGSSFGRSRTEMSDHGRNKIVGTIT